jgi:hypothetical protein
MRARRRTREKGVGRARTCVGVKNLDTKGAPVIEFRRAFPFKRYPDEDAEAEGWPVSRARKTLFGEGGRARCPAAPDFSRGTNCCRRRLRMLQRFPEFEHLAQGEKV